MKLKPIALAIPMVLAAGSVSAAEIYNKDSNSVDLNGWVKAFGNVSEKNVVNGEALEDDGFHVKTDALMNLKATHQIDDESKIIGKFGLEMGDSSGDKNAKFTGIKLEYDHTSFGNLSLGDTGGSFGAIEKADAGEGDNIYVIGQGGVDGQGIRYKKSVDNFNFSANYETEALDKKDDEKHYSNYALSAEYKVADSFSVAAAFGSDGDEARSYGLGGDVHIGDLRLGAAFVSFENAGSIKINTGVSHDLKSTENDGQAFSVVAEYDMDKVTVYGSFQMVTGEIEGEDDVEAYNTYVGADYNFTDSVKAYLVAQTGTGERGATEKEATGIKFGAKYTF